MKWVFLCTFNLPPDRQALSDPQGVERIQDRLIEALRLQVTRNHSTEENLFASIIMKLPELRTLGSQHNEMLRWYRARWQHVELPPLFAEIYDIPKSAEDAQSWEPRKCRFLLVATLLQQEAAWCFVWISYRPQDVVKSLGIVLFFFTFFFHPFTTRIGVVLSQDQVS